MAHTQQGMGDGDRASPLEHMVFDGSMNQIASKKQTPRSPEQKHLLKLRRTHGWKACELHKRQKKSCLCNIPVEWLERLASGLVESSMPAPTAATESIERPRSADPDRQRRDIRANELRRTRSLGSISLAPIDSMQESVSWKTDSHMHYEASLSELASEFVSWETDAHMLYEASLRKLASESDFPEVIDHNPRISALVGHSWTDQQYKEYLSRIGDADVVEERLQELRHERACLVEEGKSRVRVGMNLDEESLQFLESFDRRHEELQEQYAAIQEDLTKMREKLPLSIPLPFATTQFAGEPGHGVASSIGDTLSWMDTDLNEDDEERGLNSTNDVDKKVEKWLLEIAEGSKFKHFLQETVTGEFGDWKTQPSSETTIMARYRPSGMFDSPARSHVNHRFRDQINRRLRRIGRDKEWKIRTPTASAGFVRIDKTLFGRLPQDRPTSSVAFNMRQFSLHDKRDRRPIDPEAGEQQHGQEGADLYREELELIADMKAIFRGLPEGENAATLPDIEELAQALGSSQRVDTSQGELQGVLTVTDEDVARMHQILPQDENRNAIGSLIPQPVEIAEAVVHENMRSSEDPYLFEPGEDVEMELLIVRLDPVAYDREQLAIGRIVKVTQYDTMNELDKEEKAKNGLTERVPTSKTEAVAIIKPAVSGQSTPAAPNQKCKESGDASVPKQKTTSISSATHETCQGVFTLYSSVQPSRIVLAVLLCLTDACALFNLQEQMCRIFRKSRRYGGAMQRLRWDYVWEELLARVRLFSFALSYILNCLRRCGRMTSLVFFDNSHA